LGERVRLSGLRRREGLGAVGETVHGAFGRLLLIVFPLLLPPHRTLLRVELAVVIGVDFVEALAKVPVAFLGRHRCQPIIIGLLSLKPLLLRRGKIGRGQLLREPRPALRQIVDAEVAILFEGDHFVRRGGASRRQELLELRGEYAQARRRRRRSR
jgi:hypothetical protein